MGLITEAGETPQGLEINLSNVFESGKYIVTPTVGSKINAAITQIKNFITKNPGKPILVTIESSESKVPNYDREKFPATGDKAKDFTADKKLPVGTLSKNRANNLSTYLKTKLPKNVTFNIVDKGSQGPDWKAPFNAQDPNYTKFQYVKLYTKVNVGQTTVTGQTATVKTEIKPKICDTSIESQGIYGGAEKGFIAEQFNVQLGDGESLFYFALQSYMVPDILIVEYNGKTYTTGLTGLDSEINRLLIGTTIGNYYGGGAKPWYFNSLEIAEASTYNADQLLKAYPNEWDSNSFKSWKPDIQMSQGFFTKNKTIKPYKLKPGQIKSAEEGQKYWDSVEVVKIQQVKGVNTAKVSVVGIVGSTQWKINIRCGNVESGVVTSATGQKTSFSGKYY